MPVAASASCGIHRLEYYAILMSKNRYADALDLVLKDVDATPEERRAFKIVPADKDADVTEDALVMTPATLRNGKSVACQQAASILTRRHDKAHDRQVLTDYHRDWIAADTGWVGCDVEGKKLGQPEIAAATAFTCLEDSAMLSIHQSATALRALLAQVHAGDSTRLSDEDADVMQQQLRFFYEGRQSLDDKTTDSYYLPELKKRDRETFCRAVTYARQTLHVRNDETSGWLRFCR